MEYWQGKDISKEKKILILGESHYEDSNADTDRMRGKPLKKGETLGVISYYLRLKEEGNHESWMNFFDKVAASFGYDSPKEFYDSVFFANYIDVYCGTGDNSAEKYLADFNNRERLNDDLFEFVNENGIPVIVCFGKRAYRSMPGLNKKVGEFSSSEVTGRIGDSNRNRIAQMCQYRKDLEHANCNITLKNDLTVYAIGHPSAPNGYVVEEVRDYLGRCQELAGFVKG